MVRKNVKPDSKTGRFGDGASQGMRKNEVK